MTRMATVVLAISLVACGGKAADDHADGSGGSGAQAAGGAASGGVPGAGGGTGGNPGGGAAAGSAGGVASGGSSSGGAASGGAASGGSAGSGGCVAAGGGNGGFEEPVCQDLDGMTISNALVSDDGGDGSVSPGEGALLSLDLNEIAGIGFGMYPGVVFEADHAGVQIEDEYWFYAIFACQTHEVKVPVKFPSSLPAGTVVTITARVGMLPEDCPTAPSIQIPVTLK